MKKERTKRICNYFMKGLLLCALVFGFWFMADAGVNAAETEKNVTISKEGTVGSYTVTKGNSTYFNVTNNSEVPMKVTFSYASGLSEYTATILVGNHTCVGYNPVTGNGANTLYLYPHQNINQACYVSPRKTIPVDLTISAEQINIDEMKNKRKEEIVGKTNNKALEIPLSGIQYSLYEGVTGSGEDERWYKFNVKDRAVINPMFELLEKDRRGNYEYQIKMSMYDSNMQPVGNEKKYYAEEVWKPWGEVILTSGTYYVKILTVRGDIHYPAVYNFNLNGHDWIPANGITCSSSEIQLSDIAKKKVIAQTVPANSDDKIISVYDHLTGKTWDWYNSNTVDYDGIPSTATAPGRHAWITFKTTNGKTFTTYVISPAEKLSKPRVATGYNSAKFWVDYPNKLQTSVRIQVLKNGKWTTAKTLGYFSCGNSNPVTIKGLKPLTNYKFRVQAYANGMAGTPSDVVTMKTGSKKKPAIKSIKIVQRKKVTVKGWWRRHWVGGHLSRYEWVPPYTYTKYKVKVTLKKKVPKIGGMWVATNWVKGSKKSYTVWVPNGAQKGKKLTIRISTALGKGYGNGPEVKKVIRAK